MAAPNGSSAEGKGGDKNLLNSQQVEPRHSPDDVDEGIHAPHLLMIFDEAPGVARDIWEAAEGSLSGEHTRMLAIGNPTEPSGPFFDAFASESWHTIHVSCLEHPNVVKDEQIVAGGVTREWVEDRKRAWGDGSPLYHARVLGEFPQSGDDSLVPLAWLNAAGMGCAPAGGGDGGAVPDKGGDAPRLGVDVARYGADETVLVARTGPRVDEIVAMRGADLMQVAGRVQAFAKAKGIDAKNVFVDEIGIGSGVVDRLHEQKFRVTPVNFGAGADDREHYANVRAECYWRLREALEPREGRTEPCLALPDAGVWRSVRGQLTAIRYTFTSKGQIKIEEKDAIRKRTGRSPDHADALALTYATVPRPPNVWVS